MYWCYRSAYLTIQQFWVYINKRHTRKSDKHVHRCSNTAQSMQPWKWTKVTKMLETKICVGVYHVIPFLSISNTGKFKLFQVLGKWLLLGRWEVVRVEKIQKRASLVVVYFLDLDDCYMVILCDNLHYLLHRLFLYTSVYI